MTFKMPYLSKYIFHPCGKVQSKSVFSNPKSEYLAPINGYYMLYNNGNVKEKVTIKEIVQYGKHLQFLGLLTTGHGALKYRDVMEQFNSK